MFADLPTPPTFCLDWAHLGFPQGAIAFAAVFVSLVLTFVFLARRGMRKGWLLLVCLIVFIAIDLVVYGIAMSRPRPPRNGPPPEFNPSKKYE